MPKISPTIRFIRDRIESVAEDKACLRLYYPYVRDKFPVTYRGLAEMISKQPRGNFLIDTNILTAHEVDDDVWTNLFQHRVIVTEHVYRELEPWLSNPFYNKHLLPRFAAAA